MDTDTKNAGEEKKTSASPPIEKNIPEKDRDVSCFDGGKHGFNLGRLFLGIIILMIGFFYLGRNMGIIPAAYSINIWQLWPLLIIYFGLSMMSSRGWFSTLLGIIGTIFVLIIVLIALFIGNIVNFGVSSDIQTTPINITRDVNANSSVLNIKSGAGNINIAGGAKELVEGTFKTNVMDIKQGSIMNDGIQTADLEISGSTWNWPQRISRYSNDLDLKINSEIPLKAYLNSGASNINIDFSGIMLESANITAGVSSINLILGSKSKDSAIKIDSGVSSVKIHIPQNIGVKLAIEGGLNSKNIDKFNKIDEKNFESENYNSSDKKVNIDANLGISSLEIDWL